MTIEKSNISKLETSEGESRLILTVYYIDDKEEEKFDCSWFGQGVSCPDFLIYGEGKEEDGPITGLITLGVIRRIEAKTYKRKVR